MTNFWYTIINELVMRLLGLFQQAGSFVAAIIVYRCYLLFSIVMFLGIVCQRSRSFRLNCPRFPLQYEDRRPCLVHTLTDHSCTRIAILGHSDQIMAYLY